MTYILIAIVCVIAYAFLYWMRKRAGYYNQVSQALQRRMIDWSQIDEKYDRATYQARLEFMRKHGLSPEEAAEAVAADLHGEYNEFMEVLNAEAWRQSAPAALKDMDPKHGKQAVQNINDSFELSDLFSVMLAEKPLPGQENAQSPAEFGVLMTSFVDSLQANKDIQIEPGSMGEKLKEATENEDFDTLSELQEEIMGEIHRLSGDDRARYVFQLFWPQMYQRLNAKWP